MEQSNNDQIQQYKQCLNQVLTGDESTEICKLLKLKHVFAFIQTNLPNIGRTIQMTDILPILDHSIRSELRHGNQMMVLDDSFLALFKADELQHNNIEYSLMVLYQALKTLKSEDIKRLIIGDGVFHVLKQHLLGENVKPILKANILACFQVYATKFNYPHILATLWREIHNISAVENPTALQILITLFDDFCECSDIKEFKEEMQKTTIIEKLLESEDHDKRKCAYFLLKKSYLFMPGTPQFWVTCINVFENLEENQSHLILPSLELLKNLKPTSSLELKWLNILHRRILMHNNVLVRRWVLEYFLEHQSFHDLPEVNALQFMRALNETTLYNIEGYMLPTKYFKRFLTESNKRFLKVFSLIDWKAVPLHFWMSQLLNIWPNVEVNDLSDKHKDIEEVLLNLASKIRSIQNVNIRRHILEMYAQLFETPLASMNLAKYVELIKSLYNVSDPFNDFDLLAKKFENFQSNELESNGNRVFDQRFYEIFNNMGVVPYDNFSESLKSMIYQKLEGINYACHGYLLFLVIFDFKESMEKQTFCKRNYDLDMSIVSEMESFKDLYDLLYEKVGNAFDNKILFRRKVMDLFVCNAQHFKSFNDLESCDELLNAGSNATLLRLAILLASHKETVEDNVLESFLSCLREHLKSKFICLTVVPHILEYLKNVLSPEKCTLWTKKLLELDLENAYIAETILLEGYVKIENKEFLLQRALNGDAKTGDSRIEEVYEKKYLNNLVKGYRLRYCYVQQILRLESTKLKESILIQVCEMAKMLNLKKPRYFAHSKEHRMLTRMTYLLWCLRTTEMNFETMNELFEKLWSLLMDYNNQPNVSIIYECLIASVGTFLILMNKIRALHKEARCTSSQEVSMIMLLYRYFEKHCGRASVEEYGEAIAFLWPLTMGSSFQTRLYAQLVLVVLVEKLEEKLKQQTQRSEIETFIQLKMAIEQMIGRTQIDEFLKDCRFIPTIAKDFYNEIMYLTHMPYDEFEKTQQHFQNENYLPSKKLLETAKGEIVMERHQYDHKNANNLSFDVQRKINPTTDFMPSPNLISYPAHKEHELYVIASFIDKIPNLGGIARTCEVLGIKNLVIASKADVAKADFKNLSMTAEKTLNIIEVKPINLQEFLLQKKSEGFSIVGAEQTANSCNFVDFEFPKRALLLLGHEKEGIPSNFFSFLDYAVEIPQFGMVRSLNVHVTGALFMWEYCKQHICKVNLLKNKS